MIPSALEGMLGLWLVWVAVLDPALIGSRTWIVGVSAIAIIVLAIVALFFDYLKWPAVTDIVVGVVLLAVSFTGTVIASPIFTFWMLFWAGSVVGTVSLWSVFYRHGPETLTSGDTPARP